MSCTCVLTDLSLLSNIHAHMAGWCFLDELSSSWVLLVVKPECACRSLFEQYFADKHYTCVLQNSQIQYNSFIGSDSWQADYMCSTYTKRRRCRYMSKAR